MNEDNFQSSEVNLDTVPQLAELHKICCARLGRVPALVLRQFVIMAGNVGAALSSSPDEGACLAACESQAEMARCFVVALGMNPHDAVAALRAYTAAQNAVRDLMEQWVAKSHEAGAGAEDVHAMISKGQPQVYISKHLDLSDIIKELKGA